MTLYYISGSGENKWVRDLATTHSEEVIEMSVDSNQELVSTCLSVLRDVRLIDFHTKYLTDIKFIIELVSPVIAAYPWDGKWRPIHPELDMPVDADPIEQTFWDAYLGNYYSLEWQWSQFFTQVELLSSMFAVTEARYVMGLEGVNMQRGLGFITHTDLMPSRKLVSRGIPGFYQWMSSAPDGISLEFAREHLYLDNPDGGEIPSIESATGQSDV